MKRESEKEWYFGNADKERSGPYSFQEVPVSFKLSNFTIYFHPGDWVCFKQREN